MKSKKSIVFCLIVVTFLSIIPLANNTVKAENGLDIKSSPNQMINYPIIDLPIVYPPILIELPYADFEAYKTSMLAGNIVRFEFTGVFNFGPNQSAIAWNFGDGCYADSSLNPTHRYDKLGIFTVTLKIICPSILGSYYSEKIKVDYIEVFGIPPINTIQ